jgi:hypothetical protein
MDTLTWSNRHVEPRDCVIVKVSTPVFSWRQPYDGDLSVAYTFEVRNAEGRLVASRSNRTPRLILAETPLAPGNYTWTVSYRNKSGATITSASRRFNVSAASVGAVIPSSASIVELALRKPRPRALPAGASFAEIATLALRGEYATAFDAYMTAAGGYRVEASPSPPPTLTRGDFANGVDYIKWMNDLSKIASKERNAIEYLGYAARFSGDSSYAVAGVARLLNLAAWPTRGATSEASQDQANRAIYEALALGLDLYSDNLTSNQTAAIVAALRDRLQQVIMKLPTLDASPYQSHLVNSTRYLVIALLHAVGTPGFPEAQDWLATAWDTWITVEGTWGADGDFATSTSYSWFAGIDLARTAATLRVVTGIDLSRWPAIGKFGNNQIAFTAPSTALLVNAFGDGIEYDYMYRAYTADFYRLYAAVTQVPSHEWYWRAAPGNINTAKPLPPLHYMMLGLKQSAIVPSAPAANSWAFEDAGLVAIHSSTADPLRSSLYFRSSRFGSLVHSNADNNAFTFVSRGQPLFISGGYYPYFNSPHHALVERATRFKNALTFDGGIGQAEIGNAHAPTSPGKPAFSKDARGEVSNFYDNGTWAVATGDASLAYRWQDSVSYKWTPWLNNAIRSVAYNRAERVAVIYDWATSDVARKWELNFQMPSAPSLNASTLHAAAGSAQGCVDVYNLDGAFHVTRGFPVAPENGLPDQYQARYAASLASTQLVAVTVIREDCRAVPVTIQIDGTSASVSVNGGAPLVLNRMMVTVP